PRSCRPSLHDALPISQSPWDSIPSVPWGPLVFLSNLRAYLAVLPEDPDQDLHGAPACRSTAMGELTGTRTTVSVGAELASSMRSWSGCSWTADTLRTLPSALMGSPP